MNTEMRGISMDIYTLPFIGIRIYFFILSFCDNLNSRNDRGLRELCDHIIDDTNLSTNRKSSEVIS